MLVLTRKRDQSIAVSGTNGFSHLLKLTVLDVARGGVRLGFEVDSSVSVHRWEVWQQLCNHQTNRTLTENQMTPTTHVIHGDEPFTRENLVALLNEDLAGEYQAIISYVIYSQVLKGAQYMNIAAELEKHAAEELAHALTIAGQIDYLGGMPLSEAKPVQTSSKAEDMLHFDLENENTTIARYRQRVRQCEALGEFALAEQIRTILVQEQDHQVALATALGVQVPNVTELERALAVVSAGKTPDASDCEKRENSTWKLA